MNKPVDARERYLDIAARQFAEAGFHGVSLATLAKDAGVTKQALLHFFGTKEKLYGKVLEGLTQRLCAEIDAASGTPEERLIDYFERHAEGSLSRPEDVRLVIRALLDSRQEARRWPMKSYLDRLVALAQQTSAWREKSEEETLAGLYRLIGALQYFAISRATLSGMFGVAAVDAVQERFREEFRQDVLAFLSKQ